MKSNQRRNHYRKQDKKRFFELLHEYREVRDGNMGTPEDKQRFIRLSIAIHVACGNVPKSYKSLVNK